MLIHGSISRTGSQTSVPPSSPRFLSCAWFLPCRPAAQLLAAARAPWTPQRATAPAPVGAPWPHPREQAWGTLAVPPLPQHSHPVPRRPPHPTPDVPWNVLILKWLVCLGTVKLGVPRRCHFRHGPWAVQTNHRERVSGWNHLWTLRPQHFFFFFFCTEFYRRRSRKIICWFKEATYRWLEEYRKESYLRSSKSCFYIFLWLNHATCMILVSRPGIEPMPLEVEAWILNHRTARGVPSRPQLNQQDGQLSSPPCPHQAS